MSESLARAGPNALYADSPMRKLLFSILLIAGHCAQGSVLTPDPAGGLVSGTAGSTVGWGFTFDNQDNLYALFTASTLTPTASIGDYVDYLSLPASFLIAPPNNPIGVSFCIACQLGAGEFDI